MRRVLIADDELSVRELCRSVLGNEGFEVLEAASAPECVAVARESAPDLVLLDWMMPGVSGMEALRILKGSDATRAIPVVMLTALHGHQAITEASQAGADGYVTKPFESESLLRLVERFVAQPVPPAV